MPIYCTRYRLVRSSNGFFYECITHMVLHFPQSGMRVWSTDFSISWSCDCKKFMLAFVPPLGFSSSLYAKTLYSVLGHPFSDLERWFDFLYLKNQNFISHVTGQRIIMERNSIVVRNVEGRGRPFSIMKNLVRYNRLLAPNAIVVRTAIYKLQTWRSHEKSMLTIHVVHGVMSCGQKSF